MRENENEKQIKTISTRNKNVVKINNAHKKIMIVKINMMFDIVDADMRSVINKKC